MQYFKFKKYLRTITCFLTVIFLCACSEDKPDGYYELESPYPVIDTGISTLSESKQKIYWLDNNTLLFYALSEQGEGLHLYYWPTKDLKLIHKMDVSLSQTYCYSDGVLWVDKAHLKKNMDGHFKVHLDKNNQGHFVVSEKSESDVEKTFYRDFHCLGRQDLRVMDKWPIGYMKDFGYFAYESEESEDQVILEREGDSEVLNTFSYDADKFLIQNLGYYPHLNKYLFVQIESGSGRKYDPKHYQFRFLNSIGVMGKPFSFPEPWDQNRWLIPTKAGYLIGGLDRRIDYDFENKSYPAARGYFLQVGDGRFDFMKIIKGVPRSAVISPDGCLLAMDHKYYKAQGKGTESTIKIIDFCKKMEAKE